jgi:type IV pilus assembly protein PilN
MKNLEVEFGLTKVDLKSLSSEKNGERSFVLEFLFGEANEFTGYHVL